MQGSTFSTSFKQLARATLSGLPREIYGLSNLSWDSILLSNRLEREDMRARGFIRFKVSTFTALVDRMSMPRCGAFADAVLELMDNETFRREIALHLGLIPSESPVMSEARAADVLFVYLAALYEESSGAYEGLFSKVYLSLESSTSGSDYTAGSKRPADEYSVSTCTGKRRRLRDGKAYEIERSDDYAIKKCLQIFRELQGQREKDIVIEVSVPQTRTEHTASFRASVQPLSTPANQSESATWNAVRCSVHTEWKDFVNEAFRPVPSPQLDTFSSGSILHLLPQLPNISGVFRDISQASAGTDFIDDVSENARRHESSRIEQDEDTSTESTESWTGPMDPVTPANQIIKAFPRSGAPPPCPCFDSREAMSSPIIMTDSNWVGVAPRKQKLFSHPRQRLTTSTVSNTGFSALMVGEFGSYN
ncbi:hypothetical protein FISHEDRAFT_60168 [Fistulina hepatica ATCC 64428]|uniref:Uncharacterized protein n=1 Tax=Fistulina hepatica ATCC 64428 TaxID=1128425 RepID=A0A0D7A8G8_9AGAR|nr:hypothetical protein FISHEDRAFT_60168 [Fistulina hepatica ATCC 64428]